MIIEIKPTKDDLGDYNYNVGGIISSVLYKTKGYAHCRFERPYMLCYNDQTKKIKLRVTSNSEFLWKLLEDNQILDELFDKIVYYEPDHVFRVLEYAEEFNKLDWKNRVSHFMLELEEEET